MKKIDLSKDVWGLINKIEKRTKDEFINEFIQKLKLNEKTGNFEIDYKEIEKYNPKKEEIKQNKMMFKDIYTGALLGFVLSVIVIVILCSLGIKVCL